MASKDTFTGIILQIIRETAEAKGVSLSHLGLDSPVDGSLGLDSLDWAAVVVRVELETGIDPFAVGKTRELRTVSDLVDLYMTAAQ